MTIRTVTFAALAALSLLACTEDETEQPAVEPGPACTDPLEIELADGSCARPGIAPDGCAEGFVHDGEYGCEPVLPAERCPPGLMAVPGDTACRPLQTCGTGTWGDIPVDAATQYVDASYSGNSDGTGAIYQQA